MFCWFQLEQSDKQSMKATLHNLGLGDFHGAAFIPEIVTLDKTQKKVTVFCIR